MKKSIKMIHKVNIVKKAGSGTKGSAGIFSGLNMGMGVKKKGNKANSGFSHLNILGK